MAINQDIKAIIPTLDIDPAFFGYFVTGLQDELLHRWRKPGTTVESIEHEYLANDEIPLPPKPEQRAIVAFLDERTANIDALIAKKERLLALLAEKRQALITRAVTKGLDPTAPMKDTGIPWLGQIPRHWTVKRVKHLAERVVDCLHTTPRYDGELIYPAIRTSDLDRGRLFLYRPCDILTHPSCEICGCVVCRAAW